MLETLEREFDVRKGERVGRMRSPAWAQRVLSPSPNLIIPSPLPLSLSPSLPLQSFLAAAASSITAASRPGATPGDQKAAATAQAAALQALRAACEAADAQLAAAAGRAGVRAVRGTTGTPGDAVVTLEQARSVVGELLKDRRRPAGGR
jgi:hypothetical protein